MLISDLKKVVLSKTINRVEIPVAVDFMNKCYTGLKVIARETIPLKLVVNSDQLGYKLLRKVDTVTWIRIPNKPTNDTSEVDIDDVLIDALALYIIAGIEKEKANIYMSMFWQEMDASNSRLIEFDLVEGSNDSDYSDASSRFC